MKPVLLLFSFVIISYTGFSQGIKGTAIDSDTQKPVSGVHIYLKKMKLGTISDDNGKFQLTSSSEIGVDDTLIVSHITYKKQVLTFHDLKEQDYQLTLVLEKKELGEVSVKAEDIYKAYINYTKITSLNSRLYAFGSTKVGDKVYIIGGDESASTNNVETGFRNAEFKDFGDFINKMSRKPDINYNSYNGDLLIYDVKANSWKIIPSQFGKRAYHNIHFHNNKIYVIGGKWISRNRRFELLANEIEVYHPKSYTVEIDKTIPHQAANFASVIYKDNVIIFGGSTKLHDNGEKDYTSSVHMFNISTGYWYQLDNMAQAKETTGILINDKVYLVGGFNKKALKTIESFDLSTNSWETEAELFEGMYRPALAYAKGIIYIFENGKICTFNIKTRQLNEYKIGLYLSMSAMYCSDNELFIFGGCAIDEYSIAPSSKVYSINLSEFIDTKINNSKK